MKLFRISLLLFSVALLFSCIAERYDCPTDRSVILEFAYEYNGDDYFRSNVRNVDLFIFDDNDVLVDRKTIGSTQLNTFAGTILDNLEPGNYRVVAWGNAAQRTQFVAEPGDHIDDARVRREGVLRSGETHSGDGDHLHYAPGFGGREVFSIYVPLTGERTYTLPFTRAYIEIQVFLVGYDGKYPDETQPPIVEIGGAAPHYDFGRVPFGDITLRETTERVQITDGDFAGQTATLATFRTKLFDIADMTKELRVYSALEGNPLRFTLESERLRIEIAEYMRELNIASLKADPTPQRIIPIMIPFDGRDVSVQVTVPEFEVAPVDPEIT